MVTTTNARVSFQPVSVVLEDRTTALDFFERALVIGFDDHSNR